MNDSRGITHRAGVKLEPGWPCNGPLLRLAEDVAKRLIVAFDTKTGMPYGTINLRHGIPEGETTVTCTAGIGTLILEFGTLSRLTGDPLYEEVNFLVGVQNIPKLAGNTSSVDSIPKNLVNFKLILRHSVQAVFFLILFIFL